jgi:hypothetical protein
METIRIINGSKDKLSENLTMQEVWNSTNPKKEWNCPVALIKAFQIYRDWIGAPVICSSTCRNPDPYGRGSAHEEEDAIDMYSRVVDMITPYNTELINYTEGRGSELIEKLRAVGIDGFGIEKNCIHNETNAYGERHGRGGRKGQFLHTDKYGTYTCFFWTGFGPNDINKAF